ncbi:MAG: chorismate mutase [candidate division KSB1 bacterium]
MPDIDHWRERIDNVDAQMLSLLNQRARYVLEIGKIKLALSLPVYMPERERWIYDNVERINQGPLSNAAVRRLFERIIDESRRLEKEANEGEQ